MFDNIAHSALRGQAGYTALERAGGRTAGSATALALRPSHHRRGELLDRRRAHLLHDREQLEAQELERTLDTLLAEGAERPQIGPADRDAGRAHAQGLADVGAAAEAGIDQDRHAS